MKLLTLFTLISAFPSMVMALSIYDTKNKTFISEEEFVNRLPDKGQIVLGEYHYQVPIQAAQGDIINKVVKNKTMEGKFSVAWEFLNYPDQKTIEQTFSNYVNETIKDSELIDQLFSTSQNPRQNDPYISFFEATKDNNGEVLGSNAPRSWKRIITKDGLAALEAKYIPPMMELGSENYKERFTQAMGGHIPKEKVQNYYEAQCYTDSVMAWSMMELAQYELKFLIVGSFHTDYNDGVVAQLKRYFELPTVSVKILETKGMTQDEINQNLLTPHPKYGALADYLYLLD